MRGVGRSWLMQPRSSVVRRGQELQFLLLALIFVVRNSHHAEEAGRPHLPGDEGLLLRREHRHMFNDLAEEARASINVPVVLRDALGRLALVNKQSWLDVLRPGNAPLPLPLAKLRHVFRVVAKVEHFKENHGRFDSVRPTRIHVASRPGVRRGSRCIRPGEQRFERHVRNTVLPKAQMRTQTHA